MPYPRGPNTIGFSHVHNTTVNETHSKERKKKTFSFSCMLAFVQAGSVPVHALITIEKKNKTGSAAVHSLITTEKTKTKYIGFFQLF